MRVRAYSVGRGAPCAPLPSDDGAPLRLHAGWRADALTSLAGPGRGGPVSGGTNVSIAGVCLPEGAAAACKWGAAAEAPTSPVVVAPSSGGAIVCSSGAVGGAGLVPLYLASNATAPASFRATGLSFEYYALEVAALAPVAGPVAGGTRVRLRLALTATEALRGQVAAASSRCRLGVAAEFGPLHASADEIICVSPAAASAGAANATVSLDGAWFAPPRPFTYYDAALRGHEPTGGPASGGTLVRLWGEGFVSDGSACGGGGGGCAGEAAAVRCSFGMSGMVPPLSANATHVTCAAPRAEAAGAVALSLSLDAGSSILAERAYAYFAPPAVSSLTPPDGPAAGGHAVTVRGRGFQRLGPAPPLARCRFGGVTTALLHLISDAMLVCASPHLPAEIDAWRAAAAALAASNASSSEVGDDATFVPTAAPTAHCCAAGGGGGSRVGVARGVGSASDCWASCVALASCRYFSYYVPASADSARPAPLDKCWALGTCHWPNASGVCDLCATCGGGGVVSGAAGLSSWRRVEPALPALLPFSLSLNGQQFALNEEEATAELGYVAYAHEVSALDVSGGPTSGGTLVTLSGRGFTRAAARAATARARFGELWWGRAAALAPRCRFGAAGAVTPVVLRDDYAVCAAPPLAASGGGGGGGAVVALELALNAFRFDPHAAAPLSAGAGASYEVAHFESDAPHNFSYYPQAAAQATPAGGPTAGGTRVVVVGSGLEGHGRAAAACRFGAQLITPLRWGSDSEANCTAPAWPTQLPPIPRAPDGEPLSAPTLVARQV